MKQFLTLALFALLSAPAAALPAAPAVHMDNDAFTPKTLTIDAGQTVTFVNSDDDAHTVTAVDGSFDSKGLDSGAVWRHSFTKPGLYAYFCELHPFMKGTIVVKAVGS
jgi:plastocyanin